MPDLRAVESNALSQTNFSTLDWIIVAGYLAVSVVIGLMVRRYASSMKNYITAGRGLGTWLGIATMTGTELGLVTVMYSAEKGYKGGFAAFHIAILAGAVTLLVGLTGFIVASLRREKVLTIPEFYEKRFGRRTRILGGIVLAFGGILNMGLFLKVGSEFIVGVTGMSADSAALQWVMTTLLALVLFYTVLGGMISVVITDYIQFVVLSFGLLLTVLIAIFTLGWDHIFATVQDRLGPSGFDPLASGGQFGVEYVSWMALLGLVGCAIWPTAVARALAMESPQAVKRQYIWSSISFTIRFLLPYVLGICAFVYVATEAADLQNLFPVNAEEMSDPSKGSKVRYAMPIFLGKILPIGILGLISAAMIAAFMSTHDSYLLTWSSVLTQDVVAPLRRQELSNRARIWLTRAFIILIGIFLWLWGVIYPVGEDLWDYMAITGAIYFTGAIPVLIGGLYWKRASSTGAFWSLVVGTSAVLGLAPLRKIVGGFILRLIDHAPALATEKGYDEAALAMLTGERVGLFCIAMTMIVFVVGSLLFPDREPTAAISEES